MAARGILTPWNTYQDAIHIWAVGLCQGSSAEDNGAFCKAANEVGLLDPKQPWVGVAIAVIGGCALAATACLRLAAETVAGEIDVAAGGSLAAGATLATFGSKLRGLYGRLEAESAQAAPGDTAALRRLLGNCKCFLAGTDVLMADGSTKDIEDIKLGDEVLATDPATGKSGSRKVSRLIRTEGDKYFNELTIATDDGPQKLTATHEHPFWSPSEKRWVEAGQLQPNATLLTDDGTTVTVTNNRPFTKHARTYNLTVEDLHTYYVLAGSTPVLVHNSDCPTGGQNSAGSTGRTAAGGKNEQQAIDLAKEYPEYGNRLPLTMKDPRWPAEDGWVKMEQTVKGVEVHYTYNTRTGASDDFKFKDWSAE
jgi:hypothetical protein